MTNTLKTRRRTLSVTVEGLCDRLFVIENGRRDPSNTIWVGDRVDLDDLAPAYGEAHYCERPSAHGDDHSGRAVDQRGYQLSLQTGADAGLPGNGRDSLMHSERTRAAPGTDVFPQNDVGVEHCDETIERSAAAKSNKNPTCEVISRASRKVT